MDGAAFAMRVAQAAGLPAGPIALPDVAGNMNHVTVLGAGADRIVVRVPRPGQPSDFPLEAWCMRQAGQQGVDVPEVLWVGHVDGRAAMVQRFVTGANAGNVPRIRQWRVLGELARRIAAVPLPADAPAALFSRFGPDPPAAWVAHVDYNLSELAAGDPLVDLGVYTGAAERAALRELVAQARNMPLDFGLVHGDLSPRNLRVDLGHDPVLIDWGSASAGPVPFTDLLHLLRARPWMGEPDDAALEAFAQGWGQALDFRTMALFELVSALDLVRWAIERAPGRLDEQVLEARNTVRCLLHTQRAMT